MIKLNRILLLAIYCLVNTADLTAMQKDSKAKEDKIIVVKGDIFIVPNLPRYECGKCKNDVKKTFSIKMHPNEPLIEVWAASNESNNWSSNPHPILKRIFPNYLPINLLADKKEGDVINITLDENFIRAYNEKIKNDFEECFIPLFNIAHTKLQIQLTCKQVGYRYENYGSFENALQSVKNDFSGYANFSIFCQKNLLKDQIIKSHNDEIAHGPFGFNYDFGDDYYSLKNQCIRYVVINKIPINKNSIPADILEKIPES
jgi:hypothetical protein